MPPTPSVLEPVLLAAGVSPARAARYAAPLAATAERYSITTDLRLAHFLAQLLHESGMLRYNEEVWGPTDAQRRYEGRRDLGNVRPGDGYRFRGRGLIQLTGRSNYRQYAKARGVDFEADPDAVASPAFAADVAGWYWNTRRLNDYADRGAAPKDVMAITRRVNGGYNGLEHRQRMFDRVLHEIASRTPLAQPAEGPFPVPEGVPVRPPELLPGPPDWHRSLRRAIARRLSLPPFERIPS